MKKITSKQIFIYVALLGLIALLAVYFMVFKKYNEQAEQIRLNNEVLQERVDALKVHYINEATYLAEMEPLKTQIKEILEPFPAWSQEEDAIMHAVRTQMMTPVTISSVNIKDREVLTTIPEATVKAAGMEEYQQEMKFYEQEVTYPNIISYLSLKNMVQLIFDSDYNLGIRSISYSRDAENNMLNGSMDLVFYSVSGTGKEYQLPNIVEYISGTENIFGMENEDVTEWDVLTPEEMEELIQPEAPEGTEGEVTEPAEGTTETVTQ